MSTAMVNYTLLPVTATQSLVLEDNSTDTYASSPLVPTKGGIFTSTTIANCYMLIGAIGVIDNLVVVIVLTSSVKMRNKMTNMFIIHQSILDFLVSIILVSSANLKNQVPYTGMSGVVFCRLWQSRVLLWALLNCSTYNLVALTVERYLEIVHPIWHKVHFHRRHLFVIMGLIWTFGFFYELVAKVPTTVVINGKCAFLANWPNPVSKRVYGFTVMVIKFVIPILFLVFCYGKIIHILHKKIGETSAAINGIQTNNREAKLQRGKRNTIKTLVIVALGFVFCWSWNQVNYFLFNLGFSINLFNDFSHLTIIFIYVNSIINPVVYALQYEQFQQAAKSLIRKVTGLKIGNKVENVPVISGAPSQTNSNTGNSSIPKNNLTTVTQM